MLGSLYTEKALWICLGNLLAGSRWTAALTDSFVAKQRNITRARHAHQLTAVVLSVLQREAFEVSNEKAFEEWRERMINCSTTFWFWNFILNLEVLVLVFVRSHRENSIDLYIEALDELMFLYFGLDHPNYSRWGSFHIRDMKFLNTEAKSVLSKSWVKSQITQITLYKLTMLMSNRMQKSKKKEPLLV